jgi:hypothetical protein
MKSSISAKQKKRGRGRPPTGVRPMIGLRVSGDETALVDAWGERHGMNRSDAIRAMIREVLHREKGCGKRR